MSEQKPKNKTVKKKSIFNSVMSVFSGDSEERPQEEQKEEEQKEEEQKDEELKEEERPEPVNPTLNAPLLKRKTPFPKGEEKTFLHAKNMAEIRTKKAAERRLMVLEDKPAIEPAKKANQTKKKEPKEKAPRKGKAKITTLPEPIEPIVPETLESLILTEKALAEPAVNEPEPEAKLPEPDTNPPPTIPIRTVKKRKLVIPPELPTEKEPPILSPIPESNETPKPIVIPSISEDTPIENELGHLPDDSNEYLFEKEKLEYQYNQSNQDYDFLYPDLNDPLFNVKIAKRKEFYDTPYDGTVHSIKEQADRMCSAEFELMPHQLFVKNFLSVHTPYTSLLLYHGLGTGKTCTAIGVSEETRVYMKQMNQKHRIIMVASPNVQDNFRMQLFNESKLKQDEDGTWNIQSCIGNSLLKEINPSNMSGLSKEKIVYNIRAIIHQYYLFMGYIEFANYITTETSVSVENGYSDQERRKMKIQNIKRVFNNRLIIIDEAHNIRITDENKNKRIGIQLLEIARHADHLRFLFLTATPMYNSYKEIIWLTNLMNVNDGRAEIELKDIFDRDGQFKQASADGTESGEEILRRKLIGYVSFIRGENPYTFPYRIYPNVFAPEHTFALDQDEDQDQEQDQDQDQEQEQEQAQGESKRLVYPTIQLNQAPIDSPLKYLNVYVTKIGDYQEHAYRAIVNYMRKKPFKKGDEPNEENLDGFGYTMLMMPLEALNIVYPSETMDKQIEQVSESNAGSVLSQEHVAEMIGKNGLSNIMNFVDQSKRNPPERYGFEYKKKVLDKYGRIFHQEHLFKYSSKIASICDIIRKSTGIVLIYSQYIDGGVVPIALALEEMGFLRYGSASYTKSLFKKPPTGLLDSVTMKPRSQLSDPSTFKQAKYVMITGDQSFSPNNAKDIQYVTDPENRDGHSVKVILISKAGAEGLDFKNVRQVHVMEPWYNMNRVEQIIGRGVRNLSHCNLPFEKRNVELYLHSTILEKTPEEECADLYVYRLAERKAVQIGRVTRLLKENAVDCILNLSQTNFTLEKLNELAENQEIEIELSSNPRKITYQIGDRAYTDVCDYMDHCEYTCKPMEEIQPKKVQYETYHSDFLKSNQIRIMERIRELFKDQAFYKRESLIQAVNVSKIYPIEEIYQALSIFIRDKEFLVDRYGRKGYLIDKYEKTSNEKGDKEFGQAYYAFQPFEITDTNASIFERSVPVEYKNTSVSLELPKELPISQADWAAKITRNETTNTESNDTYDAYQKLLMEMMEHLNNVYGANIVIPSSEKNWDWYLHSRNVQEHLKAVYEIPETALYEYTADHILDELLLHQKLILIRWIYSGSWNPDSKKPETEIFEKWVKGYFDKRVLKTSKKTGIFLNKDQTWIIYVQSPENLSEWTEALPQDVNIFAGEINKLIVPLYKLNSLVGFFALFKNTDMTFCVKDITKARNKGARCDIAGKLRIIEILNAILDRQTYTHETTKMISQNGLCVILETLMRYRTEQSNGEKYWYLRPEQAAIIRIRDIDVDKS